MKNLTLSDEALRYLRIAVQNDTYERFLNGEYQWDSEINEVRKQLDIEL